MGARNIGLPLGIGGGALRPLLHRNFPKQELHPSSNQRGYRPQNLQAARRNEPVRRLETWRHWYTVARIQRSFVEDFEKLLA